MTPGRDQSVPLNVTVSSGSGTGTLTPAWVLARWIRVVPIAETDTYDLTIKDGEGLIIVYRTGQLGTLSERLELSLGIMKTVQIANAAQDGTYKVRMDLH